MISFFSFLFTPRFITLYLAILGLVYSFVAALYTGWLIYWLFFCLCAYLCFVGYSDLTQTHHAILRNYPIIGHMRFFFESIRPEIRQYFLESDEDGRPFSRQERSLVYQRAKMQLDKRPFGTTLNVYGKGYEFIAHSLSPAPMQETNYRIQIGNYSASIFNISAMSFGALSANAIMALNKGAQLGGFAHDTGEGGFSPYHQQGGDIIWEIGSGYFGARNLDGTFSAEKFSETAANPQIKMIEIKLSQGAKPGHGGVLPAAKVSAEIAAIRGVKIGEDCISPSAHTAFSTPLEMMAFIEKLRNLSGKPVGFKLCIGQEHEFLALVKAMLETGVTPEFIVIDGKEGGTGAAPLEFMDHIGKPLRDGLHFANNALIGAGLRDKIKLGASGKIVSSFDMARALALGADWCNSARGFMFAVGCIQSQSCHTDRCPTGVATQDKARQRALVVEDKFERVAHFHKATLHALGELIASAGLTHPQELTCAHLSRRISEFEIKSFSELYPKMISGALRNAPETTPYAKAWAQAQAKSFQTVTL